MKVLLFVQSGDARPKCVKSFGDRRHSAESYFAIVRKRLGEGGQPERAWLVQCGTADMGRTCIEATVASTKYGPGPSVHFDLWDGVAKRHGRILASGGPRLPG